MRSVYWCLRAKNHAKMWFASSKPPYDCFTDVQGCTWGGGVKDFWDPATIWPMKVNNNYGMAVP